MRRYILRQYMHGESSNDSANVRGTFDFFKDAQAAVANRLCDYNEIVDSNTWQVVWRLNSSCKSTPSQG